jgi:serine palmitoyltransferase
VFYNPVKMMDLYNDMLERKIAVVVVGFPAVPLMSARIRFCLSASHTKDELDYVIAHIN